MILVMGIPWFSDALIRRRNFLLFSVIFQACYMLDHFKMNFFFSLTSVDLWESFSLSFSMKKLQTPDKPTTIHDLINCEFCQCLSDRNCKNSIYTWIHVIFILLSLHVLYRLDNPGFIKKKRYRIRFDQTNNWKDSLLNGAFPGQSEKIYVSVNLS